jgi:hypothetical protein
MPSLHSVPPVVEAQVRRLFMSQFDVAQGRMIDGCVVDGDGAHSGDPEQCIYPFSKETFDEQMGSWSGRCHRQAPADPVGVASHIPGRSVLSTSKMWFPLTTASLPLTG